MANKLLFCARAILFATTTLNVSESEHTIYDSERVLMYCGSCCVYTVQRDVIQFNIIVSRIITVRRFFRRKNLLQAIR